MGESDYSSWSGPGIWRGYSGVQILSNTTETKVIHQALLVAVWVGKDREQSVGLKRGRS